MAASFLPPETLRPECFHSLSLCLDLPAWWFIQMVKNLPTVQETQLKSMGQKDPVYKGMATHSSILTWRIPWTEETDSLQSMGLQRVGQDWATHTFTSLSLCLTFSHFTFTLLLVPSWLAPSLPSVILAWKFPSIWSKASSRPPHAACISGSGTT